LEKTKTGKRREKCKKKIRRQTRKNPANQVFGRNKMAGDESVKLQSEKSGDGKLGDTEKPEKALFEKAKNGAGDVGVTTASQ